MEGGVGASKHPHEQTTYSTFWECRSKPAFNRHITNFIIFSISPSLSDSLIQFKNRRLPCSKHLYKRIKFYILADEPFFFLLLRISGCTAVDLGASLNLRSYSFFQSWMATELNGASGEDPHRSTISGTIFVPSMTKFCDILKSALLSLKGLCIGWNAF